MKPRSTQRRSQSGRPGAGKGQREEVRRSGIYPASGPLPRGKAKVIPAGRLGQPQRTTAARARGQAQRGASASRPRTGQSMSYPQEIARADWVRFLNDFSRAHDGWSAEILVFLPNGKARLETRGLPLEGVSADVKAGESTATISAGDDAADHMQRLVPRTRRITARAKDELEITAADRTRTVLRCSRGRR